MNREELIEYIKKNDRSYKYDEVNFNSLSDEELMKLKRIIEKDNEIASSQTKNRKRVH